MEVNNQRIEETYVYSALRSPTSIRVLNVQEQTSDGVIHLRIRQIDLDDHECPAYRCVSYTWGNPFGTMHPSSLLNPERWGVKHTILLSEPEDERTRSLSVTTNLHHFLLELRKENAVDALPIWIDAVSINQDDLQERADQVNLMRRIYRSCAKSLIWLGEEAEETAPVFLMMDKLAKIPHDNWSKLDAFWYAQEDNKTSQFYALLDEHQVQFRDASNTFIHFFFRSWFHRIWTIQECKLPARLELWCGNKRASDFDILDRLALVAAIGPHKVHNSGRDEAKIFSNRITYDSKIRPTLYYLRRFVFRNPQEARKANGDIHRRQNHSYSDCLSYARNKQCTDPRDRVYGLLGLEENPTVQADYTCSVEELYTRIAELDHEEFFWRKEDESVRHFTNLPSWVPDLDCPKIPAPWTERGGNGVYEAGTVDKKGKMSRRIKTPILETEGFEVDTVIALGGTHHETLDGKGLIQSLDIIRNSRMHASSMEAPGLVENFWRTTIADLTGNGDQHPKTGEYGPAFSTFCLATLSRYLYRSKNDDTLRSTVESILADLHKLDRNAQLPTWQEVSNAAEGSLDADMSTDNEGYLYKNSLTSMFELRRFFVTKTGYMGIASQGTQEGDSIVVVKNVGYPFLMRKCASGRYRYLSLAYVHGIMHGESLASNEFVKVEIE